MNGIYLLTRLTLKLFLLLLPPRDIILLLEFKFALDSLFKFLEEFV